MGGFPHPRTQGSGSTGPPGGNPDVRGIPTLGHSFAGGIDRI